MLRARKFLSGFGVVGFFSLVLPVITGVLMATPAFAANVGTANAVTYNGVTNAVAICNWDVLHTSGTVSGSTHYGVKVSFACNWGGYTTGSARLVELVELQAGDGSWFADSCQVFCAGANRTYTNGVWSNSDSSGCPWTPSRTAYYSKPGRVYKGQYCTDFGTTDNIPRATAGSAYRYFENVPSGIPDNGAGTGTSLTIINNHVALETGHTVTSTGNMPSFPADYFSDGSAPDATTPTPVCTRKLTDTSAMTGQFSGAAPTPAAVNATATQGVWNYGDTNTTTLTQAYPYLANHTYGALSTMPTNGWTATLTVTYTATSGHLFSDGTTSKTATCSLRVDFLNPDQTTPSSTGGNPGAGGTIDSPHGIEDCEPSGWGWLNPLSLVKGMFCLFKLAFIPSSSTSTSISSMWTGITTKAPFSVMYEVVTYIPANLQDFTDAVNDYSPMVSHGIGSTNTSPICSVDNGTPAGPTHTGLCNYSGAYPFEGGGPFRVDGGTGKPSAPVYLAREIMLFIFGVLFVYACYRGVAEILK